MLSKIPIGSRVTSWLFTKRKGVEFGTTEDNSTDLVKGRRIDSPAPLTTKPRCLMSFFS